MNNPEGVCVSLYIPTGSKPVDRQENQIRFKNLLREAEDALITEQHPEPGIQDFLAPAHNLLKESFFWAKQSRGLALFLSPEVFSPFRLPITFEESVVVADRFYIKPLLPLLSGDGWFYILAVSQNEVRLFQCTRYSVKDVELKDIPKSLDQTLEHDSVQKQLQFHTRTPVGGINERPAVYHGQGVGIDNSKDDIRRFFRAIDKGLRQVLGIDGFPLVFTGVEYLFPIYKAVNTYPHLLDQSVAGNPEAIHAEDLHKKAWEIVKPLFQQEQKKAADSYRQFAGTGFASNNIREIVPASFYGRVEVLFVAVGVQAWGAFCSNRNEVYLHHRKKPDNEDLLDLAAFQTLLKGGTVYAVTPDAVPDGTPVAALLRY